MQNGQTAHLPKSEFWNPVIIRETAGEVLGESKGTVKKLVAALVEKFAKEKKTATCDKCGGVSPSSLPKCPFCGDEDVEEVKAEETKKAKKAIVRAEKAEVIDSPTMTPTEYKKTFRELMKQKEALCVDFWSIGVLCKKIRDSRAWLACMTEDERPKYRSFEAWVVEEAGFSKSYIYGLVELVSAFTEEHVRKYGRTHMLTLSSAEPGDRLFLLKELEKDPEISTREFNKLVSAAKAARKTTKLKPKGEPKTKTAAETQVATPKAVTAVFPLERTEVDMFARIQGDAALKPATDFSDQPWGKMELSNGVAVFFGLSRRSGGEFVLTVQATRDDG